MRGGSILPKPCRKSGQAKQSEPQLYTSCGAIVAKINMRRTEKTARKFYKRVLAELKKVQRSNEKFYSSKKCLHMFTSNALTVPTVNELPIIILY